MKKLIIIPPKNMKKPLKNEAKVWLNLPWLYQFYYLLIFGMIEFGRLLQAWLALENGARFAVRFAVTGSYDPQYCEEAGNALKRKNVPGKYMGA